MIIDCLSKAIFLFVIYNVISLILFGVPKSLSMTYYLYKERQEALKMLFPSMIILMCIFLIPCWLEISHGSDFQFVAFLSAASLLFVGLSPSFKDSQMENIVHDVAAILCAAFALLWVILVPKMWYIILIVGIIVSIIALLTKTYKYAYKYWLEIIAFVSTFIAIMNYYIIK